MIPQAAAQCLLPRTAPFEVAAYQLPHPAPFLLDLHIQQNHLSQVIDHVANTEYLHWLDRAAELHSDSLGYTRKWLLENDIMWFVARHEIDYLAEVHLGDQLVIATWVRDMQRIKSWRDYLIIRPSDQTIVCRAATLWVLVDLPSHRPKRISPEMAQTYAPLQMPGKRNCPAHADRGQPTCT